MKLRRNEPDTASLTARDIHSATRWATARAYYIASVGVMDPENIKRPGRRRAERARAAGIVTKMLFETLIGYGARGRIQVYGRPVTEDGLRVAYEYGFAQRQSGPASSTATRRLSESAPNLLLPSLHAICPK